MVIVYPSSQSAKFFMLGPGWVSHLLHQSTPLLLVGHGKGNPAVFSGTAIRAVWSRGFKGRAVACALRVAAIGEVVEDRSAGHVDAGLDLRTVDVLPLASTLFVVDGTEHGERAVIGATPVHVREPPASGRVRSRETRLFSQPAHRLGNRAVRGKLHIRSLVAPARLLHIDDVGFDLSECL